MTKKQSKFQRKRSHGERERERMITEKEEKKGKECEFHRIIS